MYKNVIKILYSICNSKYNRADILYMHSYATRFCYLILDKLHVFEKMYVY